MIRKVDVWYNADHDRLLGLRDTTIYMSSMAYKSMTAEFMLRCMHRNITVEEYTNLKGGQL